MNFEERLAQSQAKLEELKEKINKSIDSAKDAYQVDKKEAMLKLAKMNAAIEDFGKDVEAQVYCDVTSMKREAEADAAAISNAMNEINDKIDAKIDADMKKYDEKAEKLQAKVDDSLATADGNLNATIENNRLAKERYNSKLNATRLKVQMHQEEVKNRIESKKTELDKAAQEELIMDLLDYADDCQMVAYAYAMEAELAIMDACDEIADYEAKYGKLEDA
jgi:hypothetical protein